MNTRVGNMNTSLLVYNMFPQSGPQKIAVVLVVDWYTFLIGIHDLVNHLTEMRPVLETVHR